MDILISIRAEAWYKILEQILAMRNLKNFLCGWCCGKIHNNVWRTHLGDWFPARNFSYSISEKSLFEWKVHHLELIWARIRLYLVPVIAFFFQNQSWRLSSWKTYSNVGEPPEGMTRAAQRIFSDSTFGRSLLLSKFAAPRVTSCSIFLKSAGSILHVNNFQLWYW